VPHTLRIGNDHFAVSRDTGFYTTTFMAAKQPWPEFGWSLLDQRAYRTHACDVNYLLIEEWQKFKDH